MGRVYRAQQDTPRRLIALKLPQTGAARQVFQRFQREYAELMLKRGQAAQAERYLRELHVRSVKALGEEHPRSQTTRKSLEALPAAD